MRKRIILMALILFAATSGAACGAEPTETALTTKTSNDLNLYLIGESFCDRDGNRIEDEFSRDDEGNVLDKEGNVLIAVRNLKEFSCISSVYYDKAQLTQELKRISEPDSGTVSTEPKAFRFRFMIEPRNPVNSTLVLASHDPGALYFPYDRNQAIISPEEAPKDNKLPEITVTANRNNQVEVYMIAVLRETVTVSVKNVLGEEIDRILFHLNAAERKENREASDHSHRFNDTVVEPTYLSDGYTLHTCEICGYSYRDSFSDRLPHEHEYDSKMIPPTYTSAGYTLHTCRICGVTKKDSEIPMLSCRHEQLQNTIVDPTCTEAGYTLHECMTCKAFSYRDDETEALGHLWDDGALTKTPSCTEEGEKTYVCYRCGETRSEPVEKTAHYFAEEVIPATYTREGYTRHYCVYCGLEQEHTDFTPITEHTHVYRDSILEPTCTESGYTKHICTICGESYTDAKNGPLGHDYVEKVTQNATCTQDGVTTCTCSRCGHSYTNRIPALGHAYLYTVIQPTMESEGYTEYRCQRCGNGYRDSYTPRLTS